MTYSNSNKRIAKNTIFLYLRMALVLVISLFTTRIVLDSLGVEDYGIYNVVAGFVSMFSFLNTSMSNGIQRFYNYVIGEGKVDKIAKVYTTAIEIQLLLSLLIVVLLETIGMWYMYNKMIIPPDRFGTALWLFQVSIVSLVVVILQIPYSAAIMAYERMDYFAYVGLFDVVAKLGVAYALYVAEIDKLLLYGLLQLMIALFGFLLYYIYCKKNFMDLKAKRAIYKDMFVPMLSFSGWNTFGSFAYMLKEQGLNLLLNAFFGPLVNAARGVSNMIMNAIQGFQSNIVIAFRPQIVQSYSSGEVDRVKSLFYILSKVSYLMLAVLSIPIIIEIDYILHLWLSSNIPNYTKSFTILVLLNLILSSLNTPVSQVVHATGKMRNYQILTSVVICLILPTAYMFLKFGFNPNFVYIVAIGITIINQIICNWMLKKIFEYEICEYVNKVIFPCAIFTILTPICPLLVHNVMDDSFLRLVCVAFVTFVSSLGIIYSLLLSQQERGFVKKNIITRLNG